MAKQPASLSSLVRREQSSADVVERDIGPPRRLSFACPPRTYLDLQIHKAHTGIPHQEIIAEALEEYLRKHAGKRAG